MIEGFEDQTKPLTDTEIALVTPFVNGLKGHIGKENAITNRDMIKGIWDTYNIHITGARVRKLINHIRILGLVKRLVASSSGYYIEPNDGEFKNYIYSLEQRSASIQAVADALKKQIP